MHGKNAEKHYGRDYWSRRLKNAVTAWGPYGKFLTHRKERAETRRLERQALKDDEIERELTFRVEQENDE